MSFHEDIVAAAKKNEDFRHEFITGQHSQVVLMSLSPGEEIGDEVHTEVDQTLIFVSGQGEAILNGERGQITANTLYFVPAGVHHNFINTGSEPLKLYTIYAPPEHAPGTVVKTRAEAMAAHH